MHVGEMYLVDKDNSTLSSYESVNLKKTIVIGKVDWKRQVFCGTVTFIMSSQSSVVVLDSSFLNIEIVKWNDKELKFSMGPRQSFLGQPVQIENVPINIQGELSVKFATTAQCTGLQWLTPEQTLGKKAPFLLSQCEAIHARSIIPCFDTPSVKTPFRFEIESEYPVCMSAVRTAESKNSVSVFEQKVPMPSYLFAIASGNLVAKPIGPRSTVWAEPEMVDACKWEFEKDTEKMLTTAESLIFPYEWGTYDVLVLPPSFPFGGMENPNITFVTPTLVAGDRTLVNVIAHELAHSWAGNLVSNSSWSHFWLNEGWTVYIERRILAALHGEPYRHFAAIEGWDDLKSAIPGLPSEYTKLRLNVTAKDDPDDTFSTVPYEKGSTFLWYLENLVGKKAWDEFIPKYFSKYKYRSLNTDDFKDTLYEYLDNAKLDTVDWNLWLDSPGLPPKPDFNNELALPCYSLAKKWVDSSNIETEAWKTWASEKDVEGWNSLQIVVFLNEVQTELCGVNASKYHKSQVVKAVTAIGDLYRIHKSNNSEIKFRWLMLAVSTNVSSEIQSLADWLGTVGRMKFVRPGYKLLLSIDRQLAIETFEKHKNFYHAICRQLVEKDLQK